MLPFAGEITFFTNRATLTLFLRGGLDVGSRAFVSSGDVTDATGKLEGATGSLTLEGVQNLGDGSFTETVTGEICADLGNDKR